MVDIFVSYSRADKARVAPLVAAFEAQGWSLWRDPEEQRSTTNSEACKLYLMARQFWP